MPALFPPWTNTAFRIGLAVAALGGVAAVSAPMVYMRTPEGTGQYDVVDQPVQFDHRHHVQDDGIDCRYCHNTVERSPYAGVPATEVCMGCHSQVWNNSPMLEPVRRSYYSNTPIPWNRVNWLPDFVYFNHSIHIAKGVGCVTCHGRIDRMPQVYQYAPLNMAWCLDCHRNPDPNLRPQSEITSMTWKPAGDPEVVGHELAEAYGLPRNPDRPGSHLAPTNCTTCHR